jgi:hypothetical protein
MNMEKPLEKEKIDKLVDEFSKFNKKSKRINIPDGPLFANLPKPPRKRYKALEYIASAIALYFLVCVVIILYKAAFVW